MTVALRSRRTKADIQVLRDALYDIASDYAPATVRQLFYQLVTRGLIPKTEAAYKSLVCRLLVNMRRDDTIPYVPKACLAKPMLFAALECFDRGDLIGAGVRLREAATRFVVAACDWYGVEVKGKFLTPKHYARALRKAKQLDKWGLEIIVEIIDAGNKLAHCQSVDAATVKGGIALLFSMMDSEPYCGHERKPIATSYKADCDCGIDDCDDDDGANWWKGGA